MESLCDELLACLMDAAGDDGWTLLALRRTDTRWRGLVDARVVEVYVPPMRRVLDAMRISTTSPVRVRTWALRTLPGMSLERPRPDYRCARCLEWVYHVGECTHCDRVNERFPWSLALTGPSVVACVSAAVLAVATTTVRQGDAV